MLNFPPHLSSWKDLSEVLEIMEKSSLKFQPKNNAKLFHKKNPSKTEAKPHASLQMKSA